MLFISVASFGILVGSPVCLYGTTYYHKKLTQTAFFFIEILILFLTEILILTTVITQLTLIKIKS